MASNRFTRLLNNIQSKYEKDIASIESEIEAFDYIKFDFHLQWQPSDGWTVTDGEINVAAIDDCLNIIKKKGELTFKDFLNICI